MDSLLARLAFLQEVWLLQNSENLRTTHFIKKKQLIFSASLSGSYLGDDGTLPEHLLSVSLYLTENNLLV